MFNLKRKEKIMVASISFDVKGERIMISGSLVDKNHYDVLVSGSKGQFFIEDCEKQDLSKIYVTTEELLTAFDEHMNDALNGNVFSDMFMLKDFLNMDLGTAKEIFDEFQTAKKNFIDAFENSVYDISLTFCRNFNFN